jgi:hypothetical protein
MRGETVYLKHIGFVIPFVVWLRVNPWQAEAEESGGKKQ